MRKVRSLQQDQLGSALVEGAIILPLLFVLMFGIYEFSWLFYQQHLISTGIRDAARYLARSVRACNPGAASWLFAEENAKSLAATGSVSGGLPRVKGWIPAMVVSNCTPIDNSVAANGLRAYRGGPIVYVVTVSTKFLDPSLGLFGLLGLQAPGISLSHSERVIGPG